MGVDVLNISLSSTFLETAKDHAHLGVMLVAVKHAFRLFLELEKELRVDVLNISQTLFCSIFRKATHSRIKNLLVNFRLSNSAEISLNRHVFVLFY